MTSTARPPHPQRSRLGRLSRELWFQVIVGAVLGIAVGLFFPEVGTTFAPLNNWFIGLVKMIVVPVVFCVVVTGIASMDNLRGVPLPPLCRWADTGCSLEVALHGCAAERRGSGPAGGLML